MVVFCFLSCTEEDYDYSVSIYDYEFDIAKVGYYPPSWEHNGVILLADQEYNLSRTRVEQRSEEYCAIQITLLMDYSGAQSPTYLSYPYSQGIIFGNGENYGKFQIDGGIEFTISDGKIHIDQEAELYEGGFPTGDFIHLLYEGFYQELDGPNWSGF